MSEIIGKLVKVLPEVSGEGERGPWVRGGFVIETGDEFTRKVAFTTFGEEAVNAIKAVQVGRKVQVTYVPESREFNDKWYTDLRCRKIAVIERVQAPTPAPVGGYPYATQTVAPQQPQQPPIQFPNNPAPAAPVIMPQDNDLPFD